MKLRDLSLVLLRWMRAFGFQIQRVHGLRTLSRTDQVEMFDDPGALKRSSPAGLCEAHAARLQAPINYEALRHNTPTIERSKTCETLH